MDREALVPRTRFDTSSQVGNVTFHFCRIITDTTSFNTRRNISKGVFFDCIKLKSSELMRQQHVHAAVSTVPGAQHPIRITLRVLNALLEKQGYILLGPVELVLNQLGYGRMMFICT